MQISRRAPRVCRVRREESPEYLRGHARHCLARVIKRTGRKFLAAPSSGLINCSYPFLASFAEEGTDGAAASIFFGTCEKLRDRVSEPRRPSEETRSLMYPQFGKERGKLHKFSATAENESRLDAVDHFIPR